MTNAKDRANFLKCVKMISLKTNQTELVVFCTNNQEKVRKKLRSAAQLLAHSSVHTEIYGLRKSIHRVIHISVCNFFCIIAKSHQAKKCD